MTDYADLEKRLRAESDGLREMAGSEAFTIAQRRLFETLGNKSREAADALASLRRELEEAREALAPFAREAADWDAEHWGDDWVPFLDPSGHCGECGEKDTAFEIARFTVGDLRRAARFLSSARSEEDETQP